MSAATMAPFGPEPVSESRSMPRSCASLRAFGDASRPRLRFGIVTSATVGAAATASTSRVTRGSVSATGAISPSASTSAITSPTGTSVPSGTRTPASVPSAGASISTVTLSVSTSSSGSPLRTLSPSCLSQRRTLPVSCAIPSAGMITSAGIRALHAGRVDDGVGEPRVVLLGGHLARARERACDRVLAARCHEQFLGREARDHLATVARDDQLLLDARRRPAVARGPEGLEREDHALLDRLRI